LVHIAPFFFPKLRNLHGVTTLKTTTQISQPDIDEISFINFIQSFLTGRACR